MTSKERVLATIEGRPVDRVPVGHISFSGHTAAIILGREAYVGGAFVQWKEMNALFDAIREVPMTPAVWSRIAELAWQLDRKGVVLPLSDLVIGACVRFEKATLVTTDPHFRKIPDLEQCTALPPLG